MPPVKIDAVLDTNIIIDLLRAVPQAVAWHTSLPRKSFAITPIVWMETVQGATNTVERARAIRLLHDFRIEHSTVDDNNWAMLQLSRFHLSYGVEFPDTMIASVAVRLAVPLYTLNLKHYTPLPGVDAQRPY